MFHIRSLNQSPSNPSQSDTLQVKSPHSCEINHLIIYIFNHNKEFYPTNHILLNPTNDVMYEQWKVEEAVPEHLRERLKVPDETENT